MDAVRGLAKSLPVILQNRATGNAIDSVAYDDPNLVVSYQKNGDIVRQMVLTSANWQESILGTYSIFFPASAFDTLGTFLYWATYTNAIEYTGAIDVIVDPGTGIGDIEWQHAVTLNGTLLANTSVVYYSDAGYVNKAANGRTDTFGQVTFNLTAGTYYVKVFCTGLPITYETVVITGTGSTQTDLVEINDGGTYIPGTTGIDVQWNRIYSDYLVAYLVYRGPSKSTTDQLLTTVTDTTIINYFDTTGDYSFWYKIVPQYTRSNHTWNGAETESQYFTKSVIPEPKISVYEDLVAPGGTLHIDLAFNAPFEVVSIAVAGPSGAVASTTSTLNDLGYGTTTLQLPSTCINGMYTVTATAGPLSFTDTFAVSTRGKTIVDILESNILVEFQTLQIHNEAVIESNIGNTIFKYAFKNWNRDIEPVFTFDGMTFNAADVYIDYDTGIVGTLGFDKQTLVADYVFRFFTQKQLFEFARQCVNELNLIKPFTTYTIDSMPEQWDTLIVIGSYKFALRRILQAMMLRDVRVVLSDDKGIQIIQALLTDATSTWQDAKKDAKRRGMVQPSAIISGRYAMPIRVTGDNWRNYIGVYY